MSRGLRTLGRVAVVLALGMVPGCGERSRPAPPRARVDKRSLYGDAALVPTREGERARRELALAGQIEAGLGVLPQIEELAVDVELGSPHPRVVVVARVAGESDPLRAEIEAVLAAIVGPAERHVHLVSRPAPPTEPSAPGRPWLAFAVLGLGVSLGVAIERLRLRMVWARRP